jgi:CHAD domain-containing protein
VLHTARKRAKDLLYALELLQPALAYNIGSALKPYIG